MAGCGFSACSQGSADVDHHTSAPGSDESPAPAAEDIVNANPYRSVRLECHGPVLHVVLARPDVHDAFNNDTVLELTDVFGDAAVQDAVRVVLMRSTGKHFSAGADVNWLKRVGESSRAENIADAERLHDMLNAIACCPKPVVARVQGAALGGGCGLAAAADIAITSERAFFGFTEVRLGIAPAAISPFVLRKIHTGRALPLFLTGARFDANQALDYGLVHRVVVEDDLDNAVAAVIEDLLAGSPAALAAVKRLVEDTRGASIDEARPFTTRAIADLRAGDEGREGLSAFLEKRKPDWAQ